jgi:hypothetical protein
MKTQKWGIFAYFDESEGEWAWTLKGAFEDYDHASRWHFEAGGFFML